MGSVSFLDYNVGQVINAIEQAGLNDSTRIIYSSDHGENLGTRGLWAKNTLYEESAGIPLMMAGPDVPAGKVISDPVTLADIFPCHARRRRSRLRLRERKRSCTCSITWASITPRPSMTAR
jgi:arylsulfatase A-like enzyme